MAVHEELRVWLTRGVQRQAVASSLHGVMSGTQLWRAACQQAPKLTLRDTRAILRQLEERGLVQCLNPLAPCGRLFVATPEGEAAFMGVSPSQPLRELRLPTGFDPSLVAYLIRASVRNAVFRIIARDDFHSQREKAASTIKRALRDTCPVTLNQASRAIRDLQCAALIAPASSTTRLRAYELTPLGVKLAVIMGYRPY